MTHILETLVLDYLSLWTSTKTWKC